MRNPKAWTNEIGEHLVNLLHVIHMKMRYLWSNCITSITFLTQDKEHSESGSELHESNASSPSVSDDENANSDIGVGDGSVAEDEPEESSGSDGDDRSVPGDIVDHNHCPHAPSLSRVFQQPIASKRVRTAPEVFRFSKFM